MPIFGQNFKQNVQSQSLEGYAAFNITIVFAEISNGGYLQIYNGNHIVLNVQDKVNSDSTYPIKLILEFN
jgi:hypothetical protein